ncbi:MAG: type IV secretory system conjugative DNA transfer family protein, partial [Acidithiobacillus sp.]
MADKIHAPNSSVADYRIQRLARGGKLKTTIAGVGAGALGYTLGISYVARKVFPGYHWTDEFIQKAHAYIALPGGWRLYNPLPFLRPMILNIHYPVIHQAFYDAGLPAVVAGMLVAGILGKKHKDAQKAVLDNPVHGSARWASKADAIRAALLPAPPKATTFDRLRPWLGLGERPEIALWEAAEQRRKEAVERWRKEKAEREKKSISEIPEPPQFAKFVVEDGEAPEGTPRA